MAHDSRLATELGRLDGVVQIAGPELAETAIREGLVDEYGLMLHPVALGAVLLTYRPRT